METLDNTPTNSSIYSRLFGGVFSTLEEYPGTVNSPYYEKANKMLDRFLRTKLDPKVLDYDLVNWINSPVLDSCKDGTSFIKLCGDGNLELAKWYLETFRIVKHDEQFAFREACKRGSLKVAQWLAETYKIDPTDWNNFSFREACRNGHLETAKWLFEKFPNIDGCAKKEYALRVACENGHLETARWLLEKYPQPKTDLSLLFSRTCFFGHLEVAKLLLEKYPQIDVHYYHDSAFQYSCEEGHLNIAKWLVETYPETKVFSDTLETVCIRDNLPMVKFLMEKYPDIDYARAFSHSYKKFEISKWYQHLSIHADKVLVRASADGNLDGVIWLLGKFPETKLNIEPAFSTACRCGQVKVIQWMKDNLELPDMNYKEIFTEAVRFGYPEVLDLFAETDE